MARIALIDSTGWELPDYFTLGPGKVDGEDEARALVNEVVMHHISHNKLANV